MNIFHRPYYTSEATLFLDGLRAKDPKVERGQQLGRSLLWDKSVDREAWREFRAAQVPQQPYVYQTHGK